MCPGDIAASPSLSLVVACAASLPLPSLGGAGPSAVGEPRILAERILRRESDALLFDESQMSVLVAEIDRVLVRVRERTPALAAIRAAEPRRPAMLLLAVEPHLLDALGRLLDGGRATGNRALDALDAKLGIRKGSVLHLLHAVMLEIGERVNVDAAAKAYGAIDGVVYVEPDMALGGGSDIEAARSEGLWHLVFRRAWGDCPSGCTNEELFFFVVDGGEVIPVELRRARGIAAFSDLLTRRGW